MGPPKPLVVSEELRHADPAFAAVVDSFNTLLAFTNALIEANAGLRAEIVILRAKEAA